MISAIVVLQFIVQFNAAHNRFRYGWMPLDTVLNNFSFSIAQVGFCVVTWLAFRRDELSGSRSGTMPVAMIIMWAVSLLCLTQSLSYLSRLWRFFT